MLAGGKVLADRKARHEQGNQLCNDHRGEDLDPHGFPQTPLVNQRLGHDAEAGKRQDAGETKGLGEIEVQLKIEENVRGQRPETRASRGVTDRTAARNNRPRIAATNPEMSSSSRPIRKKNMKMPMPRMRSISRPGSTRPVMGPRITPAMA